MKEIERLQTKDCMREPAIIKNKIEKLPEEKKPKIVKCYRVVEQNNDQREVIGFAKEKISDDFIENIFENKQK